MWVGGQNPGAGRVPKPHTYRACLLSGFNIGGGIRREATIERRNRCAASSETGPQIVGNAAFRSAGLRIVGNAAFSSAGPWFVAGSR